MIPHGPSIRQHPEVHKEVTKDNKCLQCHDPNHPVGPPIPHRKVANCLRCHNDEIKQKADNSFMWPF